MSQTPQPSGQTPLDSASPVPKPISGSDPHPLSPLPPVTGMPHAASGWSGSIDPGTRLSVATQELGADKLLLAAKRIAYDGKSVPSLGGIPILAKLGQGGMGAVYFGIHPRLEKEVAVKVLPFLLAEQQPDLVQRFFREARIAARVQSPHLVGVMDVNEENGLFFLVMEYVHGETGKKYLQRILDMGKPGLEEAVALEICIAAARGLSVAHAQNVVHRDIKPDNILIPWTREGDRLQFDAAKVSDLGLARGEDLHQSLTGTQSAMGTPGYMSPEQAMDAHSAGVGADVFSLGATLYAFLSGRAPFTGASVTKVIFDTVQAPHTPIQKYRTDLSPNTVALIDRCLRKNPAERFSGGAEVLAALQSCRGALGEPEPTIRGNLPGNSGQLPHVTPVTPLPSPVVPATPSGPYPAPQGTPLPVGYTPPPSAPSTLNPAAAIPVVPAGTPIPPAHAAVPASVPALPPPAPKRSGAWVALAAMGLLAAGGYFGWQHLEQTHREEQTRQHRLEVSEAVSAASRAKAGGPEALRAAVAALAKVEGLYASDPSVDLAALRALKTEYETAISQAEADVELAKLLAHEGDPEKLPQILADIDGLAKRLRDTRGLDLSRLEAARARVQKRREALDARQRNYLELLDKAEEAAKTDPDEAQAKLEEAEKLGAADAKEGLPDLHTQAERRIASVRALAHDTREAIAKKKAEALAAQKVQERRDKFKRDYDLAYTAFQNKNMVLAQQSLKEGLETLGELDHMDKGSAKTLLATVQLEVEKSTKFAEALKKGEELLEQKHYEAAIKEFRHASDLWSEAPQKDRVAQGLKLAQQGLAAESRKEVFGSARALLEKEQWAEASAAYAKLEEAEPQSVEAREGLTAARYGKYMKEGADALAASRWTAAEQSFNDALKERVNDPKARRGAADARYGSFMADGKSAMAARNYKAAFTFFQKALAERPGDADAENSALTSTKVIASELYAEAMSQGRKLLESGRAQDAAEAFRRALQAQPGDHEAQAALAATSSIKVTLQATDNWMDSSVRLKAGDRFKVSATGEWKAYGLGPKVGPSGKGGTANGRVMNRDDAGNAFFAETLIARVMGAQQPQPRPGLLAATRPVGPPPFYIGDGGVFTATSDGMLQFRMNEENPLMANPMTDNQGSVVIHISVVPGQLLPGNEEKGRLGVAVQELTAEVAQQRGLKPGSGALVVRVLEGSPAAAAGIQEGDLIVSLGGRKVETPQELVDASAKLPEGNYKLSILRKGNPIEVLLRLGDAAASAQTGVPSQESYGPYETFGTFGVYANKQSQGIPLDRNGKVVPVRTDLDKDQYEEAMKARRSLATIEKGTRVRIEVSGSWFSGPGGEWVGGDGRHADGKDSLKQFRAFRGPNDAYNIAMLVVYVSEKDKNETLDFTRIAAAGQAWAVTNKNEPLEFVMPATGILRFQQNRDGYYDVTQGALNVTVKLAKPK